MLVILSTVSAVLRVLLIMGEKMSVYVSFLSTILKRNLVVLFFNFYSLQIQHRMPAYTVNVCV